MIKSHNHDETPRVTRTADRRRWRRRLCLSGLCLASLASGFLSSYKDAPARTATDCDGPRKLVGQSDDDGTQDTLPQLVLPANSPADSEELQAEALTVIGRLVASYPDDPETYALMARLQAQLGDPRGEKEYWELCLERDPKHARAERELEALASRQGEPPLPTGQPSTDVRVMSEKVAQLYTYAARLHSQHGDVSVAEALWQRATLLAPQDINCRQALAYHYLQRQKPLETIRVLGQLADLEPENPTYALEIARLNLGLDRFDAAEQVLLELCERIPGDPSGYVALVQLYLGTNRNIRESTALAQKAVELAPSAENHVILAATYERNGDLSGAIADLESALRLDPGNERYQQMHEQLKQKLRSLKQP